jgi:hypothetical protein
MTAGAQSGGSQAQINRNIVINIRMVEADSSSEAELDKGARDKKQVDNMIANGKARLVAEVELEGANNRPVTTHIGQRVPIQTGPVPVAARPEARSPSDNEQRGQTTTAAFGFGVPQIQYQNTGVSVHATPILQGNGKIWLALNLTLSDFNASLSTLTPIFISQDFNSTMIIGEGETVPILNALHSDGAGPAQQPGRPSKRSSRFMILLHVHSVD